MLIVLFILALVLNVIVWCILPEYSRQKHEKEMLALKHKHALEDALFKVFLDEYK